MSKNFFNNELLIITENCDKRGVFSQIRNQFGLINNVNWSHYAYFFIT